MMLVFHGSNMKCLKRQRRVVIISLESLIAIFVHRQQNLNSEVMSKDNKQKSGKKNKHIENIEQSPT